MQARTLITITLVATLLCACTLPVLSSRSAVKRGQVVFAKECSQCHGTSGQGAGAASLGLGVAAPSLSGLTARNDGAFPREFVRRFVLGQIAKTDPDAAMPDFSTAGLSHVYPNGGADGEVLEANFQDLLAYLEAIQE